MSKLSTVQNRVNNLICLKDRKAKELSAVAQQHQNLSKEIESAGDRERTARDKSAQLEKELAIKREEIGKLESALAEKERLVSGLRAELDATNKTLRIDVSSGGAQ